MLIAWLYLLHKNMNCLASIKQLRRELGTRH